MKNPVLCDDQKVRCAWVNPRNPLYIAYHDQEWGVPLRDEPAVCELFLLETFQAGLSWECVLNKREAFREAFDDFDLAKISRYSEEKIQELKTNPGIIRNEAKIRSAVSNARILLAIRKERGSFSEYLWSQTDQQVIHEVGKTTSALSDRISKDLKKRGMHFVGSTTIYAFLQAMGIIESHEPGCFMAIQSIEN